MAAHESGICQLTDRRSPHSPRLRIRDVEPVEEESVQRLPASGLGQEDGGVVRRGAKLLHAYAAAVVPRVTVVLRKAYGGAYIAMGSKGLGADRVYAWPGAQVDVMGAPAAVEVLHRRELAAERDPSARAALVARLVARHEAATGGLARALHEGVVDAVIEHADTRRVLLAALAQLTERRARLHANGPL